MTADRLQWMNFIPTLKQHLREFVRYGFVSYVTYLIDTGDQKED